MLFREQHRAAGPVLQHVPVDAAAMEERPRIDFNARPVRACRRIRTGSGRRRGLRDRKRHRGGE